MKPHGLLKLTSVLSVVLTTLHLAGDTARAGIGTAEAGGATIMAAPILAVWLYGTLVLDEKRSGHVIMLIGALIAILMPVFHLNGPTGLFTGTIARSGDSYLFAWTFNAIGVTGILSLILAVEGLWKPQRDR